MFSSNATQVSAVTQAEAVDFDGTNDYLSRTSDLAGNSAGKTFTFSVWIWRFGTATNNIYFARNGAGTIYFKVQVQTTGEILIESDVSLSARYSLSSPSFESTFYNILVSVDLTNASKRYFYVNDVDVTGSVAWNTYTNANIAFNQANHYVGGTTGSGTYKGRLSNVYLDKTYRDLSITANRRLFVTADLKPAAGQAALNPILYLPMSDPTTVGTNTGTGGNFTLTGTVARSGRGPNQYNAPYSALDGAADFLSRTTAPTGIADSKTFTAQFVFRSDNIATGNRDLIAFGQDASNPSFFVRLTSGAELDLQAYNAAGSVFALGAFTGSVFKTGRNYVLTISVDLSDTAKRHVYINGEAASVTWSTYLNLTIDFNIATTPKYNIAKGLGTVYYNGQLGAVWFNTSYIDLSVASNLAKFVSGTGINAKPVDLGASGELPTGTSPLIYLPMYGNNAGKNYGTGGDFTVNSGPYTGARGPNEFWENKAVFNGTTGYLSASSTSMTASKTFTFVIRFNRTTAKNQYPFSIGGGRFILYWDSVDNLVLAASNSAGTQVLNVSLGTAGSTNPCLLLISVDLSSTSLRSVYRAIGVTNPTSFAATWTTYTNDSIDFARVSSTNRTSVGTYYSGSPSTYMAGYVSLLYFSTQYTDFSVEANRLKFIDCFGYATNIPEQITAGVIPNPPIYLRFDPASFGTNSGTDGNFTVSGTITDGGQL